MSKSWFKISQFQPPGAKLNSVKTSSPFCISTVAESMVEENNPKKRKRTTQKQRQKKRESLPKTNVQDPPPRCQQLLIVKDKQGKGKGKECCELIDDEKAFLADEETERVDSFGAMSCG
eukprot:Sdes_comp20992_c0_seq2m19622